MYARHQTFLPLLRYEQTQISCGYPGCGTQATIDYSLCRWQHHLCLRQFAEQHKYAETSKRVLCLDDCWRVSDMLTFVILSVYQETAHCHFFHQSTPHQAGLSVQEYFAPVVSDFSTLHTT